MRNFFLFLFVTVIAVSLASWAVKNPALPEETTYVTVKELPTAGKTTVASGPVTTKFISITEHSQIESETEKETTTHTTTKKSTTNKSTTATTKKVTTKKVTTTKHKTSTTSKITKPTTTVKPTTKKTTTKSVSTASKAFTSTSVVTTDDLNKIRNGFLQLVNQERAKRGVKPLSVHPSLTASAKTRSKEIISSFSHTRPNGKPFHSVIDKSSYPYSFICENIQFTSHIGNRSYVEEDLFVSRDDQIVEAYTRIFNNFKNSTEHYRNMINPDFLDTGIGISYKINNKGMAIFYIVQILGDPKS